jgi:Spy/CpxP family protein refolding chaperone
VKVFRFIRHPLQVALGIVLIAGLASPHVLAGQNRHKWWTSEKLKSEIGLTTQQSQDIEAIFQSVLPRLRAGKSELDQLEQQVSRLLAEGTADEATFAQALDRVEAARGALNKARTLMLFRMYRVLSPEQRVKLRAVHERFDSERRQRHGSPTSSR